MKFRYLAYANVLVAGSIAVWLLLPEPASGQGSTPTPAKAKAAPTTIASAKGYVPPKTPWGDPDLQGQWPGTVNIPLQRAKGTAAKRTQAEIEKINSDSKQRVAKGNWIEYYPATEQTALIVDPPDGRLPEMKPEAIKRNKEVRGGMGPPSLGGVEERADGFEDFDLWGRCITKGLIGSMLPGNLYNKGNRITQSPGLFIVQNEMVHETRIIPIGQKPHVGQGVRTYMGDGRGHWEGNTMVVETTNFKKDIGMNGLNFALLTEELKITEKFTRTAQDKLSYDATIEDPGTWTRPWTMHVDYPLDPTYDLYEYACHEANYGLSDILKGARLQGKAPREKQ
jgi:hypothetical protein